jgi:hypothetical protein
MAMSAVDPLRVLGGIGLVCGALAAIRGRTSGRLQGSTFALLIVGLGLWTLGLALSFAGI